MSDITFPVLEESNHPSHPGAEPLSPEAKATLKAARAERLAARIEQAEQTQTGGDGLHILHDPIEDDPQIAPLIKAAEKKAGKLVRADPIFGGGRICMGLCHVIWATQREILQEEYGIEWFSPAEMNPNSHFD